MDIVILDEKLKKYIKDSGELNNKLQYILTNFNYRGKEIHVKFVESLERLSEILNDNVPEWVIGSFKDNDIYIIDPKFWRDKEASTVIELILHEMVHIIVNDATDFKCPIWLNEALAVYFSGQGNSIVEDRNINIKNPYKLSYEDDIYYYSYIILKEIIKEHKIKGLVDRVRNSSNFYEDSILGEAEIEKLCERYNLKD